MRQPALLEDFVRVRAWTEKLAAPLSAEDQVVQSMPDASPTKWHRAHTTWFFETFLLGPRGIPAFDANYNYLFNSYYEAIGARHTRAKRGLISRPSVDEVTAYRRAVDARLVDLIGGASEAGLREITPFVRLGLAHEEQHQELILTDILHAFAENPTHPTYRAPLPKASHPAKNEALAFVPLAGGIYDIGVTDSDGFVFDNEGPRHREVIEPFELADRLVTVGEMKAFIREGGYSTPSLWLSDGLHLVESAGLAAPLYAELRDGEYLTFGLHGLRVAHDDEPVTHLSFYEADAIAHFLGGRLPTEGEWEVASAHASKAEGAWADAASLVPNAATRADGESAGKIRQLYGDAWEWTRSAYSPYPGYAPTAGAIGEYNGKFMANQFVLRGGSFLTPRGHVRSTYRNFWHPHTRFQATGVRVAKDLRK